MPDLEIPSSPGNKRKLNPIDISDSTNFDLPDRDPGKVPSLGRPVIKAKKSAPITRIPPTNLKTKVEQDLAIAATRRPVPPPNPKVVPTSKQEPKLSELL